MISGTGYRGKEILRKRGREKVDFFHEIVTLIISDDLKNTSKLRNVLRSHAQWWRGGGYMIEWWSKWWSTNVKVWP